MDTANAFSSQLEAAETPKTLDLADARQMPIGELVRLPAATLCQLQAEVIQQLKTAQAAKTWFDAVLERRFSPGAAVHRDAQGRDTGTISFDEQGIKVTADLPKRPQWDQKKLADIAARIRAAGDRPEEFLDITYKVSERRYNAWPEALKSTFSAARTVKTGKPSFQLHPTERSESHEC